MKTVYQAAGSLPAPTPSAAPELALADRLLVRRTLVAALALGVAGDLLFRDGPRGVGFTLFTLATLGALAAHVRVRRASWNFGACLLLVPTLFFAATFLWRDSEALAFFNFVALAAAMAALATALLRGEDWEPVATVAEYLRGARRVGVSAAGGSALLLRDAHGLNELAAPGRMRHAGAVGRGMVIALPLLFVFGSLLTSADPVFARIVHDLFALDLDALASHLAVTAVVGWVAGGYLRSALFPPQPRTAAATARVPVIGAVELGLALGSLDVLFGGFVLVQLRYLFGGAAHVAATAGVSYAEYARSGFFELVWVAVLVLPMLLAADALLRPSDRAAQLTFRVLAATLLALLGVVMLSAMQRMWLYQRAYGLTDTRVYASAAMVWLAVVFAWFAATVLRGRRAPFAFGALVSGWLVLASLDAINPDALIARTNLRRLDRGEEFDATYLTRLSEDATPTVVEARSSLPQSDRCRIDAALLRRLDAERDWRTWNLGRARAVGALAERRAELVAGQCPPDRTATSP